MRHYPTIVALPGADAGPEQLIDFWAGPFSRDPQGADDRAAPRPGRTSRLHHHRRRLAGAESDSLRLLGPGKASRRAQLARDAMRRFSVDSDRVYLTGHGTGGDAAWDLGLAHPDLWAGVMPIVGWPTDTRLATPPMPSTCRGTLWTASWTATAWPKPPRSSIALEAEGRHHGCEYLGRGFEPFGDELQRLFEWMSLRKRTTPEEFECVTMRPWDNFFWWLEVRGLADKMVAPSSWPPRRGARPLRVGSKLLVGNKIAVSARADAVTVWLSPDLVKFDQPLEVDLFGRSIGPRGWLLTPDLACSRRTPAPSPTGSTRSGRRSSRSELAMGAEQAGPRRRPPGRIYRRHVRRR